MNDKPQNPAAPQTPATTEPTYSPAPGAQPHVGGAEWQLAAARVARQAAEFHGLPRAAEDLVAQHLAAVGPRSGADVTATVDAFLGSIKSLTGAMAPATPAGPPPMRIPDAGPPAPGGNYLPQPPTFSTLADIVHAGSDPRAAEAWRGMSIDEQKRAFERAVGGKQENPFARIAHRHEQPERSEADRTLQTFFSQRGRR